MIAAQLFQREPNYLVRQRISICYRAARLASTLSNQLFGDLCCARVAVTVLPDRSSDRVQAVGFIAIEIVNQQFICHFFNDQTFGACSWKVCGCLHRTLSKAESGPFT